MNCYVLWFGAWLFNFCQKLLKEFLPKRISFSTSNQEVIDVTTCGASNGPKRLRDFMQVAFIAIVKESYVIFYV